MEAEFSGHRPWRQIMRARECGEEVVESVLVGKVDGGQMEAPLVLIAVKKIVLAKRCVEDVAGRDARRVVVVILGVGAGNGKQAGGVLRR